MSTEHVSERSSLIMVVEDHRPIQNFIAATLKANGYSLITTDTGTQAVAMAYSRVPDVILLDLGLPDIDGINVLTRIREGLETPIIVVSARGDEKVKVEALDAGADDYLSKPFGTGELLARIRVALRRSERNRSIETQAAIAPITIGPLHFDGPRREVSIDGSRIHLTPIEFRLLEELVREQGKVLTHSYLVSRVWGPGQPVDRHNVRVFMATLRRKIEPTPNTPRIILTEVGIGYRLRNDW